MASSACCSKNIQLVFEQYQKARCSFVQSVADLANRQSYVKCLECASALELLLPLLSDKFPTVRQCAAVATARLAEHNAETAQRVLDCGMLDKAMENLNRYNVFYKRSALYILRAVAKHNVDLASSVVRAGALDHIVPCLQDFDTQVKENAAWALGYIGRHSPNLSSSIVDAGALPLLVLAFQEPETCLKQIVAGALVDLAKYRPEDVAEAGAICHLVKALDCQDPKLKRSALAALSAIASGGASLAEAVVAGGIIPPAISHLGHEAAAIRSNAASLLRDIVMHSVDLAQLVVNAGGCGPLVQLLKDSSSDVKVPSSMALGFIAGQADQLAMAVISSKAVPALVDVLQQSDVTEAELCATAWALGHIAKHSPQHSQAIAVANAFPRLLQLYMQPSSSAELQTRCYCALKLSLQCCLHRPALEPLLHAAPAQILKHVLIQYAKILPNDAQTRRLFVVTGALKRVQEISATPGSTLKEYINIINSCFPDEIVKYYSPGYSETLLDKVERYSPQIPEVFVERVASDCQTESTTEVNN